MKILLATDSSEHSEAATDAIVHQHFAHGSEIRVVSVVERTIPMTYGSGVLDTSLYDTLERDANEAARAAVDKASVKLSASGNGGAYTVTTSVLSGSPKQVLLDAADAMHADLIVLGSHGYGAIDRFLLGSVSQAVALHAKCSVLIVRTPRVSASPDDN